MRNSDDPIDPEQYDHDYDIDNNHYNMRSVKDLDISTDMGRIRIKEDNALKLVETVFDNKTRLILFKLISKGFFETLEGAISTGKEANVYFAKTKNASIAIKIFRIDAPSFRKMRIYIEGDHRFKRFQKSRSGLIEVWAKKEFKNLKRLQAHNIPAPRPLHVSRNILLMEFLGDNNAVLPRLKDSIPKKPNELYKNVMKSVRDMYRLANLVHADLSEYNILYNVNTLEYFIIDVSQSVLIDHPKANWFLMRDLSILNKYFRTLGVKVIDLAELYRWTSNNVASDILLSEFI